MAYPTSKSIGKSQIFPPSPSKWAKVPEAQKLCPHATTEYTTGHELRTYGQTESITSFVWTLFESNARCLQINTLIMPCAIVGRHNSLQVHYCIHFCMHRRSLRLVMICCYRDVCNNTETCNYTRDDAHYTNIVNINFATISQLDTSLFSPWNHRLQNGRMCRSRVWNMQADFWNQRFNVSLPVTKCSLNTKIEYVITSYSWIWISGCWRNYLDLKWRKSGSELCKNYSKRVSQFALIIKCIHFFNRTSSTYPMLGVQGCCCIWSHIMTHIYTQ